MVLAILIGLAYLAGSIPSAVWVGRAAKGIDVRKHGSGNMGAANVARVLGFQWAVIVGLLDVLKGFAPVFWLSPIASQNVALTGPAAGLVIGAAAIVGHLFPVFAGFKGGKGVLTAAGVFLALLPLEVGIGIGVWLLVFLTTRIVSLGSMLAVLALVAAVLIRRFGFGVPIGDSLVAASMLLFVLVVFTHRTNVRRLLRGEESRFRNQNRHVSPD